MLLQAAVVTTIVFEHLCTSHLHSKTDDMLRGIFAQSNYYRLEVCVLTASPKKTKVTATHTGGIVTTYWSG